MQCNSIYTQYKVSVNSIINKICCTALASAWQKTKQKKKHTHTQKITTKKHCETIHKQGQIDCVWDGSISYHNSWNMPTPLLWGAMHLSSFIAHGRIFERLYGITLSIQYWITEKGVFLVALGEKQIDWHRPSFSMHVWSAWRPKYMPVLLDTRGTYKMIYYVQSCQGLQVDKWAMQC